MSGSKKRKSRLTRELELLQPFFFDKRRTIAPPKGHFDPFLHHEHNETTTRQTSAGRLENEMHNRLSDTHETHALPTQSSVQQETPPIVPVREVDSGPNAVVRNQNLHSPSMKADSPTVEHAACHDDRTPSTLQMRHKVKDSSGGEIDGHDADNCERKEASIVGRQCGIKDGFEGEEDGTPSTLNDSEREVGHMPKGNQTDNVPMGAECDKKSTNDSLVRQAMYTNGDAIGTSMADRRRDVNPALGILRKRKHVASSTLMGEQQHVADDGIVAGTVTAIGITPSFAIGMERLWKLDAGSSLESPIRN